MRFFVNRHAVEDCHKNNKKNKNKELFANQNTEKKTAQIKDGAELYYWILNKSK